MNPEKLAEAEALFRLRYPEGFASEELQHVRRKHNVERLSAFAQTALAEANFGRRGKVLDDIVKIVTRSSMVSLFEKPKFRDYVNGLARGDREYLASGYRQLLHGDQQRGFEQVLDVLDAGQLAKWSLTTIVMYQYRPQVDVFVKPTTTKNVIRQFELEGLVYRPRPSWDFYVGYRAAIDAMKARVSPSLAPNNAAFTGFLMMSTAVRDG
ncbi:MAG: hypothetical protein KF911_04365 [Pseudomonadales bacterium]|nr:hypothetical protein [Pseudomonadales bacterium]